jgi:hypothetical protein
MTEKRQTSQSYIIRILQHFATKLRNITNFVMLFQAVMKFLSRSKFCSWGIGPLVSYSIDRFRIYSNVTFQGAISSLYSTAGPPGCYRPQTMQPVTWHNQSDRNLTAQMLWHYVT